MGLVDDILQGLPVNPLLREQVSRLNAQKAAVETELAIVKDDNRQLQTENADLQKQIKELSHKDNINDVEIGILKDMADIGSANFTAENMAHRYPMTSARFGFHLQRLKDADLAACPVGDDMGWHWTPTQKGLELLVERDLI
jgi:regulator of replication initiation timing